MTAEAGATRPPSRYEASEHWGEPDEWVGSVNDPRTREENGIRWNEKWVYLLRDGSKRLVYWHRYDYRGAVHVAPDGSTSPEEL